LTATTATVATRTVETAEPQTLAARLLMPASAAVAAGATLLWSTTASTPGGTTEVVGVRRLLGVVLSIGGHPGATRRRGEKSGRRVGRRLAHGEFLEEKLVAGLEERGKQTSAAKVNTDVGELLVEAAEDDVENESTIRDLLTKTT
jgi:hypothetical protein